MRCDMDKITMLNRLKEDISTYEDFSDIKYQTKYISSFGYIFGTESEFTRKARHIASGWGIDGAIDMMDGKISSQQFNRNKHKNFVDLLDEAISYLEMEEAMNSDEEMDNMKSKVFIVHGHDDILKYKLSDWLRKNNIDPIILHEQPNSGIVSILEKLEKYSEVDCAIILFTADDIGSKKNEPEKLAPRARQNVIFEAGLFIGMLEREKVIMLCDKDIELPGDLSGCIYIEADENDGWKEKLRTEFDNIGIKYKL